MNADLIRHARLTETARGLLGIMGDLMYAPTSQLASLLGVDRRTVFVAIAELVSAGIISRHAEHGRNGYVTLVANGDADERLRALCHHLRPCDGKPGAEYTQPTDPEVARADRERLMVSRSWRLRTKWAGGENA